MADAGDSNANQPQMPAKQMNDTGLARQCLPLAYRRQGFLVWEWGEDSKSFHVATGPAQTTRYASDSHAWNFAGENILSHFSCPLNKVRMNSLFAHKPVDFCSSCMSGILALPRSTSLSPGTSLLPVTTPDSVLVLCLPPINEGLLPLGARCHTSTTM